jgi:MFS family permease
LLRIAIILACLIALVSFGIRATFGLFTEPLPAARGWDREVFALAIAIQNLFWGIGQPFAGALLNRFGAVAVLGVGGALYAAGVALSAFSTTPLELHLTAGVLVGIGMSGASYITVLGALGQIVPPERRAWALGMGTAAGSLGQFLIPPLGQAFIDAYGWHTALLYLAAVTASMAAMAPALSVRGAGSQPGMRDLPTSEVLRRAFGHTSYVLLVTGFFVCGFQLAFITTHMPPYLTEIGYSATLAAWAIGTIGLFNIVGSYIAGPAGGRYGNKYVLSLIYSGRAAAIALFLLLPPSPLTLLAFSAVLGVLWLSAAPTTSGLVIVMFGPRYMPVLFGVTFFSHQIGSFLGVWLGGVLYMRTGSYDVVWWLCVALGIAAALIHLPIAERPLAALEPQRAPGAA